MNDEARCDSRFNGELDIRCQLDAGHGGCHEYRQGPVARLSWNKMTEEQRNTVIDECIAAALELMKEPFDTEEERETADLLIGAVCFRLMLLKPENAHLRRVAQT